LARGERGLRTTIGLPAASARMQSGKRRSWAQSPPPITLPARAEDSETRPCFLKNESRNDATTSSAQALLAL
jgi:hypothetical protein